LIHVSELSKNRVTKPEEVLSVGDKATAKVISIDPAERKIGLSIRALKSDEFRADWEAYQDSTGRDGAATLGDHFRNRG
jgi:ribosomal protein S1